MPAEPGSDLKFEIGHVLFIDIVGYSKLLIHEQSEQLQKLKGIVRGTERFRLAEEEGKLLRLPTRNREPARFRSTVDFNGRTIWIADPHRDSGKRFVVRGDENLTAFRQLELAILDREIRCLAAAHEQEVVKN
jgi:hypothetical protein